MSDTRSGIISAVYNELNLPQSVTFADGEAEYLYLSDGTKLAALKDGSGLIYCGSMVFSCSFSGTAPSVDFESTGFSAGRMVKKDGAVQPEYHVNDYLCSVRVVTDSRGEVLERNDYSGYGKRLSSSAVSPAAGVANRYRFGGKEEQSPVGLGWLDFGARMYDADLARWTTPDPLAEKYPGISPYAYCNDNPVNFVDPDGEDPSLIWDIASIGFGIDSFRDNYRAGKYGAAIFDGFGIAVDVVAAFIPIIPGGIGILRTGNRVLNIADAGIDALKLGDELSSFSHAAEFGVDSYKNLKKSVEATYGTGSGLEVHHLIEKRFAKQMGMKEVDMPSIVLTKDEHRQFTAAWREAIGYDKSGAEMFTSGVEKEQILNVARDIYKDYPELLKAIEEIFK